VARPGFGWGILIWGEEGSICAGRLLISFAAARPWLMSASDSLTGWAHRSSLRTWSLPAWPLGRAGGSGFVFVRTRGGPRGVRVWLQLCGGGSWPFLRLELSGRVRMVSRRPAFF
jgi:hypothetical protein